MPSTPSSVCLSDSRSSDSTKYGTNKSSGASVTSGNHHSAKHQMSSGNTHDSVSKCRKPPLHPNYHHTNQNSNHRNATTITNTPYSVYNNNPASSNNRLHSNTVFHNNQYTFSLNRYDDSGYLESRPLSSASLYGDGQRVSRGTKSDIGVPCHRPASSSALHKQAGVHASIHTNIANKSKLPSVKSEFLLSYLNNNDHKQSSSGAIHRNSNHSSRASNDNNLNELNDCTTSGSASAYRISGVATNDYLETYKTGAKHFYANSSSRLDRNGSTTTTTDTHTTTHNSQHAINELQRNRIINFVNRTESTAHGGGGSPCGGNASKHSAVGPLLYLNSNPECSKNKRNFTDAQYQSMQNVSKL